MEQFYFRRDIALIRISPIHQVRLKMLISIFVRRKIFSSIFFLATFAICGNVRAGDADENGICFPLYRAAGAIPGTGMECTLNASGASVGLSTYFCTAEPPIIERYCGTIIKPVEECKANPNVGHPIDSSTGNKHLTETDYTGVGSFPLRMQRYYNSASALAGGNAFGALWRFSYDMRIRTGGSAMAYLTRPDGHIFYFRKTGSGWSSDADISHKLSEHKDAAGATSGWTFVNAADNSVEKYDPQGRLNSITARGGQTHTLTRSTAATPAGIAPGPNYLIRVNDQFGRELSFTWNSSGAMTTMSDPLKRLYRYTYNDAKALVSVSYPTINPIPEVRTYLYNEPSHTQGEASQTLLTGIIDENKVRLATYDYDAEQRGIGTQHAGGADKHTLAYGANQTVITDPHNSQRTYNFVKVQGALRLSGINQPGGAGCAAAANALTYDQNGNIKTRKDFNGVTATYSYDLVRNLETSRTEAAGTPQARTITTEWHPAFRLPQRIAEPKRLTAFTYTPGGNLETKVIRPTNDTSGIQGFSAPVSRIFLKASYTYDAAGQLSSVSEPAIDSSPAVNATYTWSGGNLATITNAVDHVTTLSGYDAAGRVGTIVAPNGVATTYTYLPRGWLASRSVSAGGVSRVTKYTYDAVGQVKTVTLPDQTVISYGYDDAHRLTDVTDSAGNRIRYQLDNAGNRVGETVSDPGGKLARQISRAYDALNRLETVTGITQ